MTTQQTRRRPTASDIARSLGISRATVGFVLNNTPGQTISEATRNRVIAEAARLGYQPHTAARALASGRTHVILLVLPDWPIDFHLRRNIEEASLALDEAGYTLITYTPHPTGLARPLWETLQPDVVISMGPFSPEQVNSIRAAGITRLIPDPDDTTIEHYEDEGPRLQIQYLHGLGHAKIAFAGSSDPRIADLVAARRSVAQKTAAELGFALAATEDVDYRDETLSALLLDWKEAGITAVAAYNDDVAGAVIGTALRAGLAVPADLAVVGHDDTPLATMFEPQISSVQLDIAGLGRYLAALAIGAATGTDRPIMGPGYSTVIHERGSTRMHEQGYGTLPVPVWDHAEDGPRASDPR